MSDKPEETSLSYHEPDYIVLMKWEGEDTLDLDEICRRLPKGNRAVIQMGLLRRHIEMLEEEILRLKNELPR